MMSSSVSLQPIGIARSNNSSSSSSSDTSSAPSLSSRVGNHKDYRIHRSMPLSEPLRGLPPMARPVDASYYPRATPATAVPVSSAPSSSSSSSSSTYSSRSSFYYRQRSESLENMLLGKSSSNSSIASSSNNSEVVFAEPETPFDSHLQDVYSGKYDIAEGLAFFESHGYYDVDDANTVEMFRQNFGLTDIFWDKSQNPLYAFDDLNNPENQPQTFHSVGTTLYRRHRTMSGRFELVDDDGNKIDEEKQLEREREARLKAKCLELDDYDLHELAQEQVVLVKAISAIRSEKIQFQQYFCQAFRDEDAQFQYLPSPPPTQIPRRATIPASMASAASVASAVTTPVPQQVVNVQLPPYCGNVFMLKDTIPYLLRSWHKRWFYLDFNAGLVMMYKRSYWKSPRGVLDLRTVTKVERMNQGDFRLEFRGQQPSMMLLRTKAAEEAVLWVNLLKFAKHHVGSTPAPQLLQEVSATDVRGTMTKNSGKKKNSTGKALNQVEMLAMLLSNSATPTTTTASASTQARGSARANNNKNNVSTA
ncbi:hypothetical protein Gpo141_00006069 [Globisporangium polare]